MFRTTFIAGIVTVCALAAAMTLISTKPAGADQQQERAEERERHADETKEFTGLIVDLHHYLTAENPAGRDIDDDAEIAGEHTGGPVGLLTKEEGMLRTRTELRVIVFASHDDVRRFQSMVHGKVGERVQITGYEAERDGMTAVTVKNVHAPDREAHEE